MALIQGSDAVLSFYKNDWLPFVCATDITIDVKGDILPVRTVGDGEWKKNTYQALSYTVALSGLLKFDDDNWTGWDMLDNMLHFAHVLFRISFDDKAGNVRTVQGYAMVDDTSFGISVANNVRDDFNMTGDGALQLFDGLIPCDSEITAINLTGQAASDGILHVNYTVAGIIAQIKYRIDGMGPYTYVAQGLDFSVPGLTIGGHSIEIIPVCANGYEGTGLVQNFSITQDLTCNTTISAITVHGSGPVTISNSFTGSATQMKYRIDGGAWIMTGINTIIALTLPIGAHTIEEIPICSNGVEGTGTTQSFNITTSAVFATLNYSLDNSFPGAHLLIYKNGVLLDDINTTQSKTISVLSTDSIHAQLAVLDNTAHTEHLTVTNDTTSTTIYDQTRTTTPFSTSYLEFVFAPTGGDTFTITAIQS